MDISSRFPLISSIQHKIESLKQCKIFSCFQFPKILVMGTVFSGKSSVISQMIGLDFLPIQNNTQKRRPMEIFIVHHDLDVPYIKIQEAMYLEGVQSPVLYDCDEARSVIIRLTDSQSYFHENVEDLPLKIQVYMNSWPNLQIVDLPGLSYLSGPYLNPQYRYIANENCILLNVHGANADFNCSQCWKLINKADPCGYRSLCCLTKIDIMDRGTDAVKILQNEQIVLRNGYVGVKNRSSNSGLSIQKALEVQRKYFERHPLYSRLPDELLTTGSLIAKLDQIIFDNIGYQLYSFKQAVNLKRKEIQQLTQDNHLQQSIHIRQALDQYDQLILQFFSDPKYFKAFYMEKQRKQQWKSMQPVQTVTEKAKIHHQPTVHINPRTSAFYSLFGISPNLPRNPQNQAPTTEINETSSSQQKKKTFNRLFGI